MTKKLIIIEFDYHAEVLRNTCKILENGIFDVDIFTTQEIWSKVGFKQQDLPPHFSIYTCRRNAVKKCLTEHLHVINSADCILFNTAASRFKLYNNLGLKPQKIIRIHNANANFNRLSNTYSPIFNPYYMWKDFSHFFRQVIGKCAHRQMKRFIANADGYAFSSEKLKEYAVNHFNLDKKQCIALPLVYTNQELRKEPQQKAHFNKITLTVVGKIDPRNRNYQEIISAFEIIAKKTRNLQKKVELVLLGASNTTYGNRILKSLKAYTHEYAELKHFEGFVNEEVFQNEIARTDFLIIPSKIKTRYTIYTEWYGYTKISGAINDVVKYNKPGFIRAVYPIDDSLKKVLFPYHSPEDLSEQVVNLFLTDDLPATDFRQIQEDFSADRIQTLYENALTQFMELH
ncbi:MAG: hypothetical protein ACQERC_02620 [Bacteroidota bacterium]